MGEVRTVLYKRKCELQEIIANRKSVEERMLKELNECRDNIAYYKRLLQEIMDVYDKLPE